MGLPYIGLPIRPGWCQRGQLIGSPMAVPLVVYGSGFSVSMEGFEPEHVGAVKSHVLCSSRTLAPTETGEEI